MKIVADNRGRIALGKLNLEFRGRELITSGIPGSEWDVTVEDGKLIVKPWEKAPKPEWGKVGNLNPSHIGQVIGVDRDSIASDDELRQITIRVSGSAPGVFGVLEWYETGSMGLDVARAKLAGREPMDFNNYGMFYVKNV